MDTNWIKGCLIVIILTGVLMDSVTSHAGNGRGDVHTVYQGQSVDDLIIRYMDENNVPGLTLAIVQAPYITRVVGYGLVDTDSRRLAATRTVFNIGQITNAYTAVAIMQLKEEGKVQLDTSLGKYLPNIPDRWQPITIRQLLTHSSGLPDYTLATGFNYAKNYQTRDILNLISDKELLFKPGSQMRSSASNPYLLGLIIEQVSGMSYQDYVTKNQIERLGLKHTFFISNAQSIANEITNGTNPFKHSAFLHKPVFIDPVEAAVGYSQSEQGLVAVPSPTWSATFAASGIIASAEDISLWDIGLAGDILVKDTADRSFLYSAPTINNHSVPGNAGWFFPGHKGLMEIKGAIPGYSAFLSRFTDPSELLCVTLLANKGNLPDLDSLARKIAASFDAKLGTPVGSDWSETVQSPYSVSETLDRVSSLIKKNGGTVFARIDHALEAHQTNQLLSDTQVIIIGNPAKGTALMQANAAFALDLPLRIMATQDASGQVWLSFTDPLKLASEYQLNAQQIPVLKQMSLGLRTLCQQAISAQSEL
ncbi:beta-lactamase [Legionella moravica]|uniref:Beta-lactamase n=1 Tax=Legionella moravica TaxID=39962 RepID=A0A378JWW8_9GAMM|nr:serine hydrolase [Legionella moravica]KTD37458.1 beta-lactamase [Legionella moravica]STX63064.1 beta-lactamase [Legionella moravica]